MAEPDKRQIGDGSDNYGEAAKQMAKAAKEAGKETAKHKLSLYRRYRRRCPSWTSTRTRTRIRTRTRTTTRIRIRTPVRTAIPSRIRTRTAIRTRTSADPRDVQKTAPGTTPGAVCQRFSSDTGRFGGKLTPRPRRARRSAERGWTGRSSASPRPRR